MLQKPKSLFGRQGVTQPDTCRSPDERFMSKFSYLQHAEALKDKAEVLRDKADVLRDNEAATSADLMNIFGIGRSRHKHEGHLQQNVAMQKPLGRIQGQLANSSESNEVVVSPKSKVGVDMIANYATHQMTGEIVVPPDYSRTITSRRLVSVFDSLDPIRNGQDRPQILPVQARLSPIPLSWPHLFDPPSVGGQHGQPQSKAAAELAHRYIHPPLRNRRERQVALAWMLANQG
ncbi:Hypothetical predicted protein [Olea europaea subsp. europaea]|uniref:Uncharacterized protein n=1 Tax=Olea europaea subsp. europaea TaxID=158383 RepID=A0A8S0U1X9_OLEEU|nr:Hypothetical predicted protein [Olea europaea subsp. europaea]